MVSYTTNDTLIFNSLDYDHVIHSMHISSYAENYKNNNIVDKSNSTNDGDREKGISLLDGRDVGEHNGI